MSDQSPILPGKVDWSGENPGIYLREDETAPWLTLAVFFRVVLSPHGRGHAAVILEQPNKSVGWPDAANLCITDNQPMMRYLREGFLDHFSAFRDRKGLDAMTWLPLTSVTPSGDPNREYREVVTAKELEVEMVWRRPDGVFAVNVPPEKCATGRHTMLSCFVSVQDAEIRVNGRRLEGMVTKRDFLNSRSGSAFLAFSETWIQSS